MPPPDRNPSRPVPRKLALIGAAFSLLAIAVVAYGLGTRQAQNARLRDVTQAQAVPTVAIAAPSHMEQFDAVHGAARGDWKPTSTRTYLQLASRVI